MSNSEQNNGAMIPADRNIAAIEAKAPMVDFFDEMFKPDWWTSLDASDSSQEALIYQARQGVSNIMRDHLGEVISIQHVLCHLVTITKEDGEMVSLPRIVLIDDQGMCWSCCSTGVHQSLNVLFGTRGKPPYVPPVKVKVRQQTTKGNKVMLTLERVIEIPPVVTKKPGAK